MEAFLTVTGSAFHSLGAAKEEILSCIDFNLLKAAEERIIRMEGTRCVQASHTYKKRPIHVREASASYKTPIQSDQVYYHFILPVQKHSRTINKGTYLVFLLSAFPLLMY